MYEMSGFVEKLNIQNFLKSMGNCVHYKCTEYLIRRKIKYPKFHKFNGKLCTLYMYKLSGFTEKLNILKYKIQREIMYIICTECLDLQIN